MTEPMMLPITISKSDPDPEYQPSGQRRSPRPSKGTGWS
jgi:hypothetical protein